MDDENVEMNSGTRMQGKHVTMEERDQLYKPDDVYMPGHEKPRDKRVSQLRRMRSSSSAHSEYSFDGSYETGKS